MSRTRTARVRGTLCWLGLLAGIAAACPGPAGAATGTVQPPRVAIEGLGATGERPGAIRAPSVAAAGEGKPEPEIPIE